MGLEGVEERKGREGKGRVELRMLTNLVSDTGMRFGEDQIAENLF